MSVSSKSWVHEQSRSWSRTRNAEACAGRCGRYVWAVNDRAEEILVMQRWKSPRTGGVQNPCCRISCRTDLHDLHPQQLVPVPGMEMLFSRSTSESHTLAAGTGLHWYYFNFQRLHHAFQSYPIFHLRPHWTGHSTATTTLPWTSLSEGDLLHLQVRKGRKIRV